MDSYILLVFEGKKTEPSIFDNIEQCMFSDMKNNQKLYAIFGGNIYNLYDKLQNDSDLSIFELLKEGNESLKDIKSNQVAEVFLFFDYDGHDARATDTKIEKMLKLFQEETEEGKLYISYPMIEALKHIKTGVDFKDVTVPLEEIKHYKKMVSENSDTCYQSFRELNVENWQVLLDKHLRKMNYICTDKFEIEKNYIEQSTIFKHQQEKYIEKSNIISVLSPVPIFLKDYYGAKKIEDMLKKT